MDKLRNYIQSSIRMDEIELDIVISHFMELEIAKDKFVLKKGQIPTNSA